MNSLKTMDLSVENYIMVKMFSMYKKNTTVDDERSFKFLKSHMSV